MSNIQRQYATEPDPLPRSHRAARIRTMVAEADLILERGHTADGYLWMGNRARLAEVAAGLRAWLRPELGAVS